MSKIPLKLNKYKTNPIDYCNILLSGLSAYKIESILRWDVRAVYKIKQCEKNNEIIITTLLSKLKKSIYVSLFILQANTTVLAVNVLKWSLSLRRCWKVINCHAVVTFNRREATETLVISIARWFRWFFKAISFRVINLDLILLVIGIQLSF